MRVLSEYKNIHTSILYIYICIWKQYLHLITIYIDIYTYMETLFTFIRTWKHYLHLFTIFLLNYRNSKLFARFAHMNGL